jgi:hypothetical protein
MTSTALEEYLSRLERELRKRGLQDRRIVDEAREHLVDAIEEGLQSGLSVDAAEREAFVRFGPPETVAGHFFTERSRMSNWLLFTLIRIARLIWGRDEPRAGHYHDVAGPSRYHFAVRLRRRYRKGFQRMSADADPRERLTEFLREFGLRRFGSSGTLESLTLLEDTTDTGKRGGRYLAAFGSGTKMIWTVALGADGGVSFDGTSAPA